MRLGIEKFRKFKVTNKGLFVSTDRGITISPSLFKKKGGDKPGVGIQGLRRHLDHLADSTAKLCQGGKGRYVGREGIPMDNSSGEECETVIVSDGSFKHQKHMKR